MRLHIAIIGDNTLHFLENAYVFPTLSMTLGEMAWKKEHNSLMIEIAYALNGIGFDDIKNYTNA